MSNAFWVALVALGLVGGYFLLSGPSLAATAGKGIVMDVSAVEMSDNCDAPEARQLDFWVGEWDLSWDGGSGTNVIRRTMGGCVIEENFSSPEQGYYGMSVSMFDARAGQWKQTWVDNGGSYLDFVGGVRDDGRMSFWRAFINPEGETVMQRMLWENVSDDSMDWRWERSLDGGGAWETLWLIHYERR